MRLHFTGHLWHWRGPSPFHFVTVPEPESADLHAVRDALSYGWGAIPVEARIGETTWRTSLFPKDGAYVLPVKDAVRRAEGLALGRPADVELTLAL